jgi:ArsR family transcriptional regulator
MAKSPETMSVQAAGSAVGKATDEALTERLVALGKALADPVRVRMLRALAQGRTACCDLPSPEERGVPGTTTPQGICVCEFQERLGLGQSQTSYHLRVLKDGGLLAEEQRGKWSFYSLRRNALDDVLTQLRDSLQL